MMVLAAGCAGLDPAPRPAPEAIEALATRSVPSVPRIASPDIAPDIAPGASPAVAPDAPLAVPAALPPALPPAIASMPKAPTMVARPGARSSPPLQAGPAVRDAAQVQAPARPAPLDLKSLEARLKATPAIGVFTKLTLKNQVDDLLDQFRAHHNGQGMATQVQLRQSYDRLLLKVLALLQDGDPPLAKAIAASRESIWDILSTPAKLAAI